MFRSRTVGSLTLREEALESRQYVITDKIMHLADLPRDNSDTSPLITERYAGGRFWCEVYLWFEIEGKEYQAVAWVGYPDANTRVAGELHFERSSRTRG